VFGAYLVVSDYWIGWVLITLSSLFGIYSNLIIVSLIYVTKPRENYTPPETTDPVSLAIEME
jgi:hypothetical protein